MRTIVNLINKIWQHQLVRFLCVGSFNTLLDFVLLNIFYELAGLSVLIANSLSVTIAISISYFLNHHIVFRYQQRHRLANYLRFFAVTGLSILLIQNCVIFLVTHLVQIQPEQMLQIAGFEIAAATIELNLAKGLAVLLGMMWNFLLYKHLVFRPRIE